MRKLVILAALCLSTLAGCGATAPIQSSSTPVTLSSGTDSSEMATVCDTYRARFRHTPVRLSDGTPVWCF